jgi:diguanylate cyclase
VKVQLTFLSSKAGRRIFWTLLLAAALPLAVFGVTMHQLLSEQFESQAARQQVQLVKFAGMGLLDRLLVARTALSIAARTGRVDAEHDTINRDGRVLSEVAQIDFRGHVLAGSVSLAQRWRARALQWWSSRADKPATLLVDPNRDALGAHGVLLVLVDHARSDSMWIAQVESGFLFNELSVQSSGSRICVFDAADSPLFCPDWSAADESALADLRSRSLQWRLFLRSDFAIDDWTFAAMDGLAPGSADGAPLARLSALVAISTLLFVGMLGLVQVRRTMGPLDELMAGTRRLSERDYSARVRLRPDDEFGELANSFNHMAEQIDDQMHAIQVQSSIDREILNGLNVSRALQRVAQRLERIVSGASAWVIEVDRDAPGFVRVHGARAPMALVGMTTAGLEWNNHGADDIVACETPPPWLLSLAPAFTGRLWLRGATAGGELLGMVAVAAPRDSVIDQSSRREIAELCDRVSVALSSANRERLLIQRASHDSLTGLANRSGLYEAIDGMLTQQHAAAFSVLFLDLDRFKEINDSLGHQAGDSLLRVIAQRLLQCAPRGTLVARPGGDEFVLLVPGAAAAADELAHALCRVLPEPVELEGRTVVVGTSVGMARHPEHGASALELMRRADMAMYSAKARGGGVAAWYDAAMDARSAERAALLADLRGAAARNELEVHYQPRIHVQSQTVQCAEALLRWRHPSRGFVAPDAFIGLLEENGLIDSVGLWVVEQALSQLRGWRAQGATMNSIAVNLSTRQLESAEFPERVMAILVRHGLQPKDLELEITESIFVGDTSVAIGTLQRLHDIGIRIALDDFGTGYSSLSYLHRLPIGVVKVDRSFVAELGKRDSALALTRSIVGLARALDLSVVAEGVETEQQVEILTELGCDELQGWLYSPALDAAAFAKYIKRPLRASAATV